MRRADHGETMPARRLSVVIPVYDEVATLPTLLERALDVDLSPLGLTRELIVVDDGSTDGSRALLEEFARNRTAGDLLVLAHERNRGKGAALRTGFAAATGDLVLVQDADLEYDPRDWERLLRRQREGDLDVVYGSRLLEPSNRRHASLPAYLGGRCLTLLTNALFRTHLTDEPTGYKLFRRSLLMDLDLECERFEFCPEVTARIARRKIPIAEVPIRYQPRGKAEGKKIGARDFFEAVWVLLRERVR